MGKSIVIVGAGYAGVLTAKKLAKRLKKNPDVTITLIDKNPYHTMLTELHEVAANRVEEDSIKISLSKIFAGRRVNVVLDCVESIDYEKKSVHCAAGQYSYDFLVLAAGSKPTFFGIAGAAENVHCLWSADDAIALREHILGQFRKAATEANEAARRKLLTFYVVGAGFTGVEMMGELAEWAPILCDEYEIPRTAVSLHNVDMLNRTVPILPEKQSGKVQRRLEKMGVTVSLNTGVVEVGSDFIKLKRGETVTRHDAATVIWTAGIEGADITAADALPKVGRGRIQTDPYLRAKGREDVYVAGDNIFFIPDGTTTPVPQMVENCEQSAHTVSHNLLAALKGGQMEAYAPKFHGVMCCIGGRYGVAHVGTDKTKFALPSFLAMFAKHFINLIYFVQVLGWNKIYCYITHEFCSIRHNRSFVGGHFSKKAPNFWLVPLRIFIGINWVIEGWDKIVKVIANPTQIFLFSFPGDAASGAPAAQTVGDAVASASQAVTDAVASATAAASQYGDALPVPEFIQGIVDWSMLAIVKPIAPLVQGLMSFAEFAVGILLIIGLFTAVSSVMSAGLCFVIYMSGMAPVSILWYFFGSIACIGGSGSTLGADYYALPALKRWWKKRKFVKKWYLYND